MARGWLPVALLAGAACTPAPPAESPSLPPVPADLAAVSGGRVLGPAGGRLSVGPVTLELPEGALGEMVRITVTPVRPGAPVEPGGLYVPDEPASTMAVLVEPVDVMLRRPVKVSIATVRELPAAAVARVASLPPLQAAWQPLAGQGRSPSLLWAQSPYLGVFGLVPVSCCGAAAGALCEIRCDVGPLRYRCEGTAGRAGCCDAFARTPRQGEALLCGPDGGAGLR